MMPDRYDEIKKRAATKKIIEYVNPDLNMQPIDVEASAPIQPYNPEPAPIIQPEKNQSTDLSFLPDLAASAGPGLLALLGGASPKIVSEQFDKGNRYAQGRGTQEEITKDKIMQIDVNGEPQNILARDAVGKKPFIPGKTITGSTSGTGGNVQSARSYSNKKTGEIVDVYLSRNGLIYRAGDNEATGKPISADVLASEYVPFKGFATANIENAFGDKTVTQMQRTNPSQKVTVGGAKGYGSMVGVPTEGIKQTEKSLDEHNKRVGDLELKASDLKSSIAILENKDATPTELTAARESLIRSISTEPRLTDEDVARAMGNDFRSLYSQFKNAVKNRGLGEMNPEQRAEFIKSAKTLIAKMDQGVQRSYEKMIGESETVPGGKQYLEKKNPALSKKLKKSTAEMEKIKQAAKKAFGNDIDGYNSFIDKKSLELGLR